MDLYEEYLQWEKNPKEGGNKPSRIICLFERAIADIPLNHKFWDDYIDYVATTLKEDETVLNICERSIANCSWSSDLWVKYLMQAEVFNRPHEELAGLLYLFIIKIGFYLFV